MQKRKLKTIKNDMEISTLKNKLADCLLFVERASDFEANHL